LTDLLHPAFGTAATGVAIVVFTVAVRSLLLPLSISQARAEKVRARLQPQVQAIQKKHRRNPERQREEILKLHRAEGASVAGGCLPALAQWPFFMVMYRLFVSTTVAGQQNVLLVHSLLGQNLPAVLTVYGVFALPTFGFVGLLGLLAGLATWSSRRTPGGNKLLKLMPYGTVVMAVFVPMAAGLYLLTTTAWTVGERLLLRRDAALAA
jgi:YidC/Oxa1 family membrane protein insertase